MSVQVHKSFFCTATNPRSANSQLMSASVYNFFCCCCNASLTSGGSSCCSLMQLVTSPLQLFPPLLLPLLPACLPGSPSLPPLPPSPPCCCYCCYLLPLFISPPYQCGSDHERNRRRLFLLQRLQIRGLRAALRLPGRAHRAHRGQPHR